MVDVSFRGVSLENCRCLSNFHVRPFFLSLKKAFPLIANASKFELSFFISSWSGLTGSSRNGSGRLKRLFDARQGVLDSRPHLREDRLCAGMTTVEQAGMTTGVYLMFVPSCEGGAFCWNDGVRDISLAAPKKPLHSVIPAKAGIHLNFLLLNISKQYNVYHAILLCLHSC